MLTMVRVASGLVCSEPPRRKIGPPTPMPLLGHTRGVAINAISRKGGSAVLEIKVGCFSAR